METPSTSDLATKVGISLSYASEIISGKRGRKPPRSLAIRILRETGWRHSVLEGLTDEQINVLEQVEPWERRPQGAAA